MRRKFFVRLCQNNARIKIFGESSHFDESSSDHPNRMSRCHLTRKFVQPTNPNQQPRYFDERNAILAGRDVRSFSEPGRIHVFNALTRLGNSEKGPEWSHMHKLFRMNYPMNYPGPGSPAIR